MRILLVNPPHPAIGSRIPHEHLPPLGLLSIGGPLIDAGHEVRLLDAEFGPMSTQEIVSQAVTFTSPRPFFSDTPARPRGIPLLSRSRRPLRKAHAGGLDRLWRRVPHLQAPGARDPAHGEPWRVLLWVKFMEAVLQVRPRTCRRVFTHPDRAFRDAMKWYSRIGRQVWSYEIRNFLFRDRCRRDGPTLAEFWPVPLDREDWPHLLSGRLGCRTTMMINLAQNPSRRSWSDHRECAKPIHRSMGILPMGRRAIPSASLRAGSGPAFTGETPVRHTGKMPVLLYTVFIRPSR